MKLSKYSLNEWMEHFGQVVLPDVTRILGVLGHECFNNTQEPGEGLPLQP